MKVGDFSILMFDAAYPPPVVGGKEKQAHLLARTLCGQGILVRALSYEHNGNTSAEYEGVYVERVRKGLFAPARLFVALVRLRKTFPILHVHTPSRIGKFMAVAGRLLGFAVVFKFPNERMLGQATFGSQIAWSAILKTASMFVVLEKKTQRDLEQRRIKEGRIFLTENGVEMSGSAVRKGVKNHVDIIFVGRLVHQKGCDILLNACAKLHDVDFPWRLTLVGGGPLMEEARLLAKSLDIERRVKFLGFHESPIDLMKEADILALPSRHEGMSNALLEAMSVGLPVVATDVGSARWQLGDYANRFLCDVEDAGAIAERIQQLMENPDMREEYGKYLLKRCQDIFSIETVSNKYIEKYATLVRG